jgi:hypothetical protein
MLISGMALEKPCRFVPSDSLIGFTVNSRDLQANQQKKSLAASALLPT